MQPPKQEVLIMQRARVTLTPTDIKIATLLTTKTVTATTKSQVLSPTLAAWLTHTKVYLNSLMLHRHRQSALFRSEVHLMQIERYSDGSGYEDSNHYQTLLRTYERFSFS